MALADAGIEMHDLVAACCAVRHIAFSSLVRFVSHSFLNKCNVINRERSVHTLCSIPSIRKRCTPPNALSLSLSYYALIFIYVCM